MLENVQEAVGEIKTKMDRFNEIGELMAEPDADFDALMAEMGDLQTDLDNANAWDLDSRLDQAMDALREVGPGGHYLGCAHTQANFKDAFWRSEVLDYKPYETWFEEGARDSSTLANARVRKLLGQYEAPAMDPAVREAIEAFVARRKAEMPDAYS